jgi:hypothetical protein
MKVYYAHCMALYDTPQEYRDLETLAALGFDVVNPNSPWIEAEMAKLKPDARMFWFERFADECDAIVFRGLPSSDKIPSGVAMEINWFHRRQKPVIELPSLAGTRVMTLKDTQIYLREVGQR